MTELETWRTALRRGNVVYVVRKRRGGPRHLRGNWIVRRDIFSTWVGPVGIYAWTERYASATNAANLFPSLSAARIELSRRDR